MKKTIMITGTSTGIGKATALYFIQKGWNVVATMRSPAKETQLTDYENLLCLRLDVTDINSIKTAIQKSIKHFGHIDVLVNNAAFSLTGPFEAATPEQIQNLYDIDVFGLMNVTREILPHFRKRNNGTIINISSLIGLVAMPLSSFYASAKWAVEGFSESLRFETGDLGIKIKIVEPGGVKTNFASNAIIVRKKDVPSYEKTIEKRIAGYEKRKNKLTEPVEIAKVIFTAAVDNSNRLRYVAGSDAKVMWYLRKILPFKLFSSLLKKLAG